MFSHSTSLQKLHTFGLSVKANQIVFAETVEQLVAAWNNAQQAGQAFLLLGEGSNVLFIDDFHGIIVVNRIKEISIQESKEYWRVHVGAGENWHQFVKYTLQHGMPGLENLALIPGCVGAAPIQNIGAYGVELHKVCDYVDVLNLQTGNILRISASECMFGYRESVFKHQYCEGYAIIAVGLALAKKWQPVLEYGDLKQLSKETTTPEQIFAAVCAMRRTKLPDPAQIGSAGSFFKNPIVSNDKVQLLLLQFPKMPYYPQENGSFKLAAGWLLDQCQLKGYQIGGAAVHQHQALVLINQSNAQPSDVVALARYARRKVGERFDVWLEPEVRFIDSSGECDAVKAIE